MAHESIDAQNAIRMFDALLRSSIGTQIGRIAVNLGSVEPVVLTAEQQTGPGANLFRFVAILGKMVPEVEVELSSIPPFSAISFYESLTPVR